MTKLNEVRSVHYEVMSDRYRLTLDLKIVVGIYVSFWESVQYSTDSWEKDACLKFHLY